MLLCQWQRQLSVAFARAPQPSVQQQCPPNSTHLPQFCQRLRILHALLQLLVVQANLVPQDLSISCKAHHVRSRLQGAGQGRAGQGRG